MDAKKIVDAVHEVKETASDKGHAALDATRTKIAPLIDQAGDFLEHTNAAVKPIADEVLVKTAAFTEDARERTVDFAIKTREQLQPRVEEALDRSAAAVDSALHAVASASKPVVMESAKRLAAASSALVHQLEDVSQEIEESVSTAVEKAKSKKSSVPFGKIILGVAIVAAVGVGVTIAIRKLTKVDDNVWEAHEPSNAYVADPDDELVDQSLQAEDDAADEKTDEADTSDEAPAAETD